MKTRKVKNKGTTKKQFSAFNDATLLSQNYYYTGTVKNKATQQKVYVYSKNVVNSF